MFVFIFSKFVDEKRVFGDIEFYFPQLAHLIIQLDQLSEKQSLERLAIVICETSMHAALQFSFVLTAAMDDYQPESAHGVKNPACNLFLYSRCARLLEDVERAVIYGGSLTNAPSITNGVSDKNREHIADTLSQPQTEKYDGIFNGELYYKRVERKSMFHLKPWKLRYFVIARRVLICYHEAHSVEPLRAIPLINCSVVVCETRPKYGNTCFEVVNESNGMRFQLRAKDEATRQKWVDLLLR